MTSEEIRNRTRTMNEAIGEGSGVFDAFGDGKPGPLLVSVAQFLIGQTGEIAAQLATMNKHSKIEWVADQSKIAKSTAHAIAKSTAHAILNRLAIPQIGNEGENIGIRLSVEQRIQYAQDRTTLIGKALCAVSTDPRFFHLGKNIEVQVRAAIAALEGKG